MNEFKFCKAKSFPPYLFYGYAFLTSVIYTNDKQPISLPQPNRHSHNKSAIHQLSTIINGSKKYFSILVIKKDAILKNNFYW
jgi:hypothetical protein